MKYAVCVEQAPDTTSVGVDPITGVLKRDGIQSKLSPCDLYAMESALGLKEQLRGTVGAVIMGPGQTGETLKECMCIGADRARLISSRESAGADMVVTSYILSQGTRRMGEYDLILCSKRTMDGGMTQVGSEVAQWLRIPHASNILGIRGTEEGRIRVRMDIDGYEQIQAMDLPCLVTMDKDVGMPRFLSYKREKELWEEHLRKLSLTDLEDQDKNRYGLSGSPTQVERIFPPERSECREVFDGSPDVPADKMYRVLREIKFI